MQEHRTKKHCMQIFWHGFYIVYTTFTLESPIKNSKLIRICFKTSSINIYSFLIVYTRLQKRDNDCFQFSRLHLSMIKNSVR